MGNFLCSKFKKKSDSLDADSLRILLETSVDPQPAAAQATYCSAGKVGTL